MDLLAIYEALQTYIQKLLTDLPGQGSEQVKLYFAGRSQFDKAVRQDLLPLFSATKSLAEYDAELLPLLAIWALHLAGAHFFDDAQDKKDIHLINAGITALGAANMALSQLKVDQDSYRDILDALGRVTILGANAQSKEIGEKAENRESYLTTIAGKAAAIIATGFWLGGRFAGRDDTHLKALKNFGFALGMVMQLSDDCTDLRDDLKNGIHTLPVLEGLAMITHPSHAILHESIRNSQANEQETVKVVTLLEQMGAMERSQRLVRAYQIQATAFFTVLPHLESRFSDYVATKT